jgi:hypothetical protein
MFCRSSGEIPEPAYSKRIQENGRSGLHCWRADRRPEEFILRKEVIQPQVPLRLPCYDFTPVADPTVAGCLRS